MNRVECVLVNALFGAAFLVGVGLVWTGLEHFMLSGLGAGLPILAAGISILVALALFEGLARPARTGGRQ